MTKKQKKVLYRIIIAIVLTAAIKILEMAIILPQWVFGILYLVPYVVIGYDIIKKALKGIKNRQPFDENFLMAVATIGAFCLGEYLEGAAVMIFYQVGELFQSFAVGKSRQNIAALMDIRPETANLITDEGVESVDPDDVEIGSLIEINPGEKIPIDGIVVEGSTMVNTSALTGESVPRSARPGDEVISGCINMSGRITVRTTKEFGESAVSKILELVENSSMKKSKSENFITKFARYYTPIVCYSALFLAVGIPLIRILLHYDPMFGNWINRGLTFLVISCPCALVISIPLSFFGGIGCASSQGILVKGSSYLEALSKAKYMVFDKTGTLTKGVFKVTKITALNGFSEDEVLKMAALSEDASSHPISKSLKEAYKENLVKAGKMNAEETDGKYEKPVSDIQEIAGHGVSAIVEGKKVLAGNRKLMNKYNITCEIEPQDGTIVYVAANDVLAGVIIISDVIKDNSKMAIKELKKNGVRQTIMLTGDNAQTAKTVGEKIGIDRIESELLPADKVTKVEELLAAKKEGEQLVFVGDGINDAPVLTRADIGVAMGALGSDAAIEAADVVLMDDDPAKLALAMKISVRTLKIVYENIAFALGVKAVCLLLGALGLAGMWLAIFADVGVMVIAVINATRALKIRL